MPLTEPKDKFDRDAKERQKEFRNTSQHISPEARCPDDDKGKRNPHLLARGYERENLYPDIRDAAITLFSQRGVQWWKNARSGDDMESDGPTRNMASSQVACLNFLLPLASIPGALTAALRAIDGDVVRVVDIAYIGDVSLVEFEWNGVGLSLEGGYIRGAQNTSVDAFLVAETNAAQRRAYLMEWKYVEKYLSTNPSDKGAGAPGNTRRRRYADLFRESSSFNPDTAPKLDDFFYEPFYQLMRQRLLADRMVQYGELGVTEAKVVVVVPEENWAYRAVSHGKFCTSPPLAKRFPQLETVEEVMRACLKDPSKQFAMKAPADLLDAVTRALPDETVDWANYWRERYCV